MVDFIQYGGRLLISYKCLATGSAILVIVGISVSFVIPSNIGLEHIRFILSRLATDMRGFTVFDSSVMVPAGLVGSDVSNDCQGSVRASNWRTLTGT